MLGAQRKKGAPTATEMASAAAHITGMASLKSSRETWHSGSDVP